MRHTALRLLPIQLLANLGKTRGGADGGRNLGTWVSFRGPTPNLWPVWYDSTGGGGRTDRGRYMTSGPTDWHQALARVSGQLVRGEQRVATPELLTVHLGVPVTVPACRRLRRVMRDLGWQGPRLMRWDGRTLKGYWRHPTVGLPAIVQEGA